MIDLMPVSTNDPMSKNNLTIAASLCATSRCKSSPLVAGTGARFNPERGNHDRKPPRRVSEKRSLWYQFLGYGAGYMTSSVVRSGDRGRREVSTRIGKRKGICP